MKKLILAGCISTLIACSNTNEFDSDLDAKVSKPSESTQPGNTSNTTAMPMPAINQGSVPVNNQQVVTTPPVTTQTQVQTQATAPGMNPAHGQPGHRCDIAVGAPLNSAPNQKAATTTATAIPQNVVVKPTTTTTTTTQKTAPGMNPAHGQPGHRCDIAVGAPLNSAPTTTTITPVTPVKQEETKPAANEQWKADLKPAPAKPDSSRN